MRVSFFPNASRWKRNPYLLHLQHALASQSVTVIEPPGVQLQARWLWQQRGQVDVLHFHWIHHHYQRRGRPGVAWALSLLALMRFAGKLLLARALGYRIVWTMHNVLPHERAPGRLDEQARWLMARLAHAVLVLCMAGRDELRQRLGRQRGVWVTSLGVDSDPLAATDVTSVRTALGLPADAFIYLYFGDIRPYKGVPDLVRCFRRLPGDNLRLLVVGDLRDQGVAAAIDQVVAADARILCEFTYVPAARLLAYLAAADVVVLPFQEILSSSSALMALSCGRPVVAPALGCLPEWITPECGLLYDPSARDGLEQALLAIPTQDIQAMQRAALARAAHFRWEVVAEQTIAAYRAITS
jgi:glycosyltransferase involved in cell wall biosynthesis